MPESHIIPWSAGSWTHAPAEFSTATIDDAVQLTVAAVESSDAWRHTAYGFVHDTEHALLAPLDVGEAMDVSFRSAWNGDFDQAGLFVRIDDEHWVKAGIEYADNHLGLGAVVTDIRSDWSVGHVDDWHGKEITVRVSRWPDAVIIRARADDGEWRLVRVAPFDGDAAASAGPFLAGPTRAGFTVRFTRWERSAADIELH
jgi:regulation of enolase protein 1 (concanavalin A-like superfamily)